MCVRACVLLYNIERASERERARERESERARERESETRERERERERVAPLARKHALGAGTYIYIIYII